MRTLTATLALATLAAAAHAQVGIDGSIGADWSGPGVTTVLVPYTGVNSNSTADVVAYRTYFRTDATHAYFAVSADASQGGAYSNAVNFSNIYIGTNSGINSSTIGMEVTNDRFFVPGVGGYYANNAGTGVVWANNNSGTIELAIPFSFLTTDPLSMGYAPATHAWFRSSQSFGYSFAFGSLINPNTAMGVPERFGIALIPTPGAAAALSLAGLAALRRRR